MRFGGSINLSTTGIEDVDADADDYEDDLQEGNNSGIIPKAKWPISIRDEDGNFDDVVHPGHKAKGNPDVIMSVPKMWIDNPVSIHQNKLMSRELAMKIGSCATPDASGNHARGDSCPISERTIYVAIASYRDYQCRDTVTSIFERASGVGVMSTVLCIYRINFRLQCMKGNRCRSLLLHQTIILHLIHKHFHLRITGYTNRLHLSKKKNEEEAFHRLTFFYSAEELRASFR